MIGISDRPEERTRRPSPRARGILPAMHAETTALETLRRLDNLVRLGTIAAIDHAQARCRVQTGGNLTGWLPWIAHRAGATRTWNPPTVGEQVIILSPSGEPAGGIVLTGLYSEHIPAPSTNSSEHSTDYPDGARISYNHATGHLRASGVQTATLQAASQVTIDAPATHITGSLTVDDLITYGNGIAGAGGSNGNVISGDLTHAGGSLSSNGVVLHTHTHPGDSGGTTGGPQ